MSKWRFDWQQESTKRGLVLFVTGALSLAGVQGIETDQVSTAILTLVSLGQAISGFIGAFRSDHPTN